MDLNRAVADAIGGGVTAADLALVGGAVAAMALFEDDEGGAAAVKAAAFAVRGRGGAR